MAHLIPSDIIRLALSGAHAPELRTLALLKGATVYGEIGFVVLNSRRQLA